MSATIPVLNVEFGNSLTGETFDVVVSEAIKNSKIIIGVPGVLIFDFSGIRYIDVTSCIHIISFSKMCRSSHWYLTFKAPTKSVLDFWNVWGFYQSFENSVGIPFARYLSGNDQDRISEPQDTFSPYVTSVGSDGNRLRSKAVFGFNTEETKQVQTPNLADEITNQWRRREVQDALEHHFGDDKDYIPPRIIFETIYNATKHANANVLLTASFNERLCKLKPGKRWARDELFTIAIWDDGDSLLDTLQQAICGGVDVREELPIPFEQEYLLNCHELYSSPKYFSDKIHHGIELRESISHELILLATLFPGTTSKPASDHETRIVDDETLTKRGLGLYTLLNSAIDVLGGTVSFRTARYFMHVRKPNSRDLSDHGVSASDYERHPDKYKKVKVTRAPQELPEFLGNMIVIRA